MSQEESAGVEVEVHKQQMIMDSMVEPALLQLARKREMLTLQQLRPGRREKLSTLSRRGSLNVFHGTMVKQPTGNMTLWFQANATVS